MTLFHVTYYYLASGMDGNADVEDYGFVEAESPNEARQKVANVACRKWSARDTEFFKGCLTARPVQPRRQHAR